MEQRREAIRSRRSWTRASARAAGAAGGGRGRRSLVVVGSSGDSTSDGGAERATAPRGTGCEPDAADRRVRTATTSSSRATPSTDRGEDRRRGRRARAAQPGPRSPALPVGDLRRPQARRLQDAALRLAARRRWSLRWPLLVPRAPAPAATPTRRPSSPARGLAAGRRRRRRRCSPRSDAATRDAIASTTKLMTAYLALRELPLDAKVTAPAYTPLPARVAARPRRPGERITVRDLLYGLLLAERQRRRGDARRWASRAPSRVRRPDERDRAPARPRRHPLREPDRPRRPGQLLERPDLVDAGRRPAPRPALPADRRHARERRSTSGARRATVVNRNNLVLDRTRASTGSRPATRSTPATCSSARRARRGRR